MAIIAFIVEAFFILLLVALVIGLIRVLLRALVAAAYIGARLCLATLGGVLAGFSAQAIAQHYRASEPELTGLLIGILVCAGIIAWLFRKPQRPFDGAVLSTEGSVAGTDAKSAEEPQLPEIELAVRVAWDRAVELVPSERRRLLTARASCARLLRLAQGNVMDSGLIDCAALVRRNVPALVDHVAALWDDADQAERAELAAELVSDLEKLAQRSKVDVDRQRQALRNNLTIVRTHVANRTNVDTL